MEPSGALRLKEHLREARAVVRNSSSAQEDVDSWRTLIAAFLEFLSRSLINALSPGHLGTAVDEVIEKAIEAFGAELALNGDPVQALKRLSEIDAVRVLTIHKCKGLEFEKVVVLGVETDFFRGEAAMSEFFVAVSRAKNELVLTHSDFRSWPSTPVKFWKESRTAHARFLAFAL